MRVDFMNPVQQAMMSIAHFGTAMYAKNKSEEYEQSQNEYRKNRMAMEQKSLELKEQKLSSDEKLREQKLANEQKELELKEKKLSNEEKSIGVKESKEKNRQTELEIRKAKSDLKDRKVANEEKSVSVKEQKAKNREKELEIRSSKTEAQNKIAFFKAGLTPKGNQKRPRKPQNAQEGFESTQEVGSNARGAVDSMRRFASGEIDLSSLGRK